MSTELNNVYEHARGYIAWRFLSRALMLLTALCASAAMAQKTDVITLLNGNNLIGDIKEMQRGLLRFSTNSMGTIYIEWLDIATIESTKNFNLETASGVLAYGSIETTEDQNSLNITYADKTVRLKKQLVVKIARVKDTFWTRLDGSVGFGFSYKKANDDLQLNLNADAEYQSRRHFYTGSVSALVSSQNQNPAAERYTGSLSHQARIRPKWSSLAMGSLEQNTELDLKLRALLLGGGLHRFIYTNRSRFDSATGLALNDEHYFSIDQAARTSLEAFASVGYEYFKFNTPKADVTVRFTVFPSLTESGRIRTTLDAKLRWEIIKDLNWAITIYTSTDNQPPEQQTEEGSQEASGTDYGIIASLDWTF